MREAGELGNSGRDVILKNDRNGHFPLTIFARLSPEDEPTKFFCPCVELERVFSLLLRAAHKYLDIKLSRRFLGENV